MLIKDIVLGLALPRGCVMLMWSSLQLVRMNMRMHRELPVADEIKDFDDDDETLTLIRLLLHSIPIVAIHSIFSLLLLLLLLFFCHVAHGPSEDFPSILCHFSLIAICAFLYCTAYMCVCVCSDAGNAGVDVFISYSWGQKKLVKKLRDFLELHHIRCWMDERRMKGGDELFGSIDQGITGCRVFLACMSNSYVASENCNREILLAAGRRKLIVPVLIEKPDTWPPYGSMGPLLAGKLYVDMTTPELFEEQQTSLVVAIKESISR
jgi:hypothetical protein